MMNLEKTILKSLVYNEEYFRKVIPFLKDEYFTDESEKLVFQEIQSFASKYNTPASPDALTIAINEKNTLKAPTVANTNKLIQEIRDNQGAQVQVQWLLDKTEEFCKEKAVFNAVLASINILDGKDKVHDKGFIPTLLSEALAVAFDPSVGHEYLADAEERYNFYHMVENRIPFDIEFFNKITKGGIPPKTLNIILAGVNVGKTLAMCHLAASYMVQGYDVLYITMEMAEEEIAKRIDANLLNVSMDNLMDLPEPDYLKRVERVRDKTTGKLFIKEFPTAGASVTHFRTLINELRLKKSFKPRIIIVDYLNIMCSSRIKPGGNVNSYTYVKSIAEELRGFAVEQDVVLWSATQLTRGAFNSTDVDMDDTAESFGLPATADFMFAMITSEELELLNQLLIKQLKSRYGDKGINRKFVVGVDRGKQRLYNVDQPAQENINDSGQEDKPLNTFGNRDSKKKFESFKV